MSAKLFFLVPLVIGPTVLITGAWRGPNASAPLTPFVPQAGCPVAEAPAQLLDRALANLASTRLSWLRTQVWQKMTDPEIGFEAQGVLHTAPHDCARLELQVKSVGRTSRLLTVSDGHALARVTTVEGKEPAVTSERLPDASARRQFLREQGVSGPFFVLQELRTALQEARVEVGQWHNISVLRIQGKIDPGSVHPSLQTAYPARLACILLDAKTLWPYRIEWWGQDRKGRYRPVLEMEYREPQLNQPLPEAECARLFSYRPTAAQ